MMIFVQIKTFFIENNSSHAIKHKLLIYSQ